MSEIYMPRLSDTMEEGVISSWVKKVGDKVEPGDVLMEIETDKALMEYEAYEEGYLVRQSVNEGDTVPIGAVIGVIGDTPDAAPAEPTAPTAPTAPAEPGGPAQEPRSAEPTPAPTSDGAARPRSSPLARRLAREYGLDVETIQGSGPKGRVVRADIEAAAKGGAAPAAAPSAPSAPSAAHAAPAAAGAPARDTFDDGRDSEELTVTNIRKVIARRMTESKQTVPHFYLRRTIDAEALKAFRTQINEQLADTGVKVSFNDLIVKAAATTLRRHPAVNSSWVDGSLLRHHRINVGIAVATEAGLMVPVVHDADTTPLSEIATAARELAGRARDGRLKPQDMSGGTFSVSNMGMYGLDSFQAVINPPESAILAVGTMQQQPVVRDGEIVARNTIGLELSIDHRAVDGAVGAEYLKDLAETLEQPMRILL